MKGFFWGIVICFIICMCTGCTTTRYINIPEYHEVIKLKTDTFETHDTLFELNQVFIREVDSAAIAEFGIRLLENEKAYMIEKSKLQKQIQNAREVKIDTFIKRDSIPVPYPVEKNLTFGQRFRMGLLNWILGILAAFLALYILITKKS